MNVMPNHLIAAYGTYAQDVALPEVYRNLKSAGFENEDICMVLSPQHPAASLVRDAVFSAAGDSAPGARMIAWFSKLGAVIIPNQGLFIRGQAFFHALLEQDFPSLSRGSKTLASLGLCEKEAKRLGLQLADLGMLLYLSCRESAGAEKAIDVLHRTGALEVGRIGGHQAAGASA
jgi:hypothetical protein